MALKPTIYKLQISLSDLNRDHFLDFDLTLAQHPSETLERMMARTLAYCLNAYRKSDELNLEFTKGLSATDEPDIWAKTLSDELNLWIDMGEPSVDRVKKASRLAKHTQVYSFNSKSDVWWQQSQEKLSVLPVEVFSFVWEDVQSLARMAKRNMDITVTLSGESAFVADGEQDCEVVWRVLKAK